MHSVSKHLRHDVVTYLKFHIQSAFIQWTTTPDVQPHIARGRCHYGHQNLKQTTTRCIARFPCDLTALVRIAAIKMPPSYKMSSCTKSHLLLVRVFMEKSSYYYAPPPPPGSRIKCCTPSVCLKAVRHTYEMPWVSVMCRLLYTS